MFEFKANISMVRQDMCAVTDASICWWAYLHWRDELYEAERCLNNFKHRQSKDEIEFYEYQVIEAKYVLSQLYDKLTTMPEFSETLEKPEWYDEFMKGQKNET